jgi:hypothetical protein
VFAGEFAELLVLLLAELRLDVFGVVAHVDRRGLLSFMVS